MPEKKSEIVRKKIVNITVEMDVELKKRVQETRRTEMQVIQDAVMGRIFLSQKSADILSDYALKHGLSLERSFDAMLVELYDLMKLRPKKR